MSTCQKPATALLLAALAAAPATPAAASDWALTGGGNWDDPLSWSAGVPDGAGEEAVFAQGFASGNAFISLGGGSFTLGSIDAVDSQLLVLLGGTLVFEQAAPGIDAAVSVDTGILAISTGVTLNDNLRLDVAAGAELRFNNAVTGGSSITLAQGGRVVLNGDASAWTGGLTVQAGTLEVNHASALGTADLATVTGGTVRLNASTAESFIVFAGAIEINASTQQGDITLFGGSALSSSGGTLAGQLGLAAGNNAALGVDVGRTLTLSGGTTGPGALRIDAAGTVQLTSQPLSHAGGLTLLNGTVNLFTDAAFGADAVITGGLLDVRSNGSLVNIGGSVTVGPGGTLRVAEAAGADALANSVRANTVALEGGTLRLIGDHDLADYLAAGTTGGSVQLDSTGNYSAGGTNALDFNTLPGGASLTLGAATTSSLAATLQLTPHASDHTLRFGGGSAALIVRGAITDNGIDPTHVDITGPSTTWLDAASTYTGQTTVHSGALFANHADALGPGSNTRLLGGQLRINTSVNEDILIDGGTLRLLADATYTMPLAVFGGTILADDRATLTGPFALQAGAAATLEGSFDIATGVTGVGEIAWTLNDSLSQVTGSLDHAGGLIVDASDAAHRLEFNSASTYTGATELSTGEFYINHAQGLGADTAGTTLHSGELTINVATNEDITIDAGSRFVLTNTGEIGSLTANGGQFLHFGVYNAPTTLAAGRTQWVAVNNRIDSVISGPGNIDINHDTSIFSTSDYTGTTYINSNVTTLNAFALGSADGETVVESGTLFIDVASLEPIRVEDGAINFRATDAPNLNPVTLVDGDIIATAEYAGNAFVEGRGILRSGRYSGQFSGDGELLFITGSSAPPTVIAGSSPFTGSVESFHSAIFERADAFNHAEIIIHKGDDLTLPAGLDRTILVSEGNLRFENAVTLDGLWDVGGGIVGPGTVNVDRIAFDAVGENNQPSGTTTVNDFALLRGTSVFSPIQGPGDLISDGFHAAAIWSDTSHLTGDVILIRGGYAGLTPDSFASPDSTFRFTSGSTASLHAPTNTDANNNISRTIDATATYFAEITGKVTGDILLSGGFELDAIGLTLAGGLDAHDLILHGGSLIGDDFSGLTGGLTITHQSRRSPSSANTPVTLTVGGEATLQALDSLTLDAGATLYLTNDFNASPTSVALQDRLNDSTGITSDGGFIHLYGHRTDAISEVLGSIEIRNGRTRVISDGLGQATTLTLTDIQRTGRGTLGIIYDDYQPGDTRILNSGVVPGAMIGAWAITTDGFASVDAQGVVATVAATSTNINTAASTDHVLVESMQTLGASKTVLSAVIGTDGQEVELDLGGNTLTVQSGGVFLPNAIYLHNGAITSGTDELIFSSPPGFFTGSEASRLTLNAEIADNGAPVALILDAVEGELGGDFNHTGGTWINNSEIDINDVSAVPVGGDLHLFNTEYEFRLTAATGPVAYGTMTIDGDASFSGPYFGGRIDVQFNQLNLGEGYLTANLVGDGLILKDKPGYFWINDQLPDFTGDLQVQAGHLRLGALNDEADILVSGGTFDADDTLSATGSAIQLAGGTLSGGGHGYQRGIDVTADSFLLGVEIDSAVTGSGQLTLRHDLSSSSGIETIVLEDADLSSFTGDMFLESGYASVRPELSGLGTGSITLNPGATLQFYGNTNTAPGYNPITLDGGGTIYATDEASHAGDVDASGIVRLGVWSQPGNSLELAGQVRLHDGLSILGRGSDDVPDRRGTVRLSGDVLVGKDVRWNPGFTRIDITGTVRPDTADASILFAGLVNIPATTATFDTTAGRTLTLLDDIGPGSLALRDGGSVVGDGTLRADVVADHAAIIAPGHSTGVLTIDGAAAMKAGSIFRADLEDHASPAGSGYDQLVVTGVFSAGGELDLVANAGFAPEVGDSFDIILADEINGGFDSVAGASLADGIGLSVSYLPTTIRLTAGIQGDLNGDGQVGAQDLDLLLANWGRDTLAGDWAAGDADGNGLVGQGDLQRVIDHWGNNSSNTGTVPEPASALLLGLGTLVISRRRRSA